MVAAPRDLATATLAFGQMLRSNGQPVTVGEVMDAVRSLDRVDLLDRTDVYLALRAVLVTRSEEQPAFDRCFEEFWTRRAGEGQGPDGVASVMPTSRSTPEPAARADDGARDEPTSLTLDAWEDDSAEDREPIEVPGLSDHEVLVDRDFSTLPFVAIYGMLQPVLPATFMKPTVLIWKMIGELRALGWYAILPLLIL